jgi:phytoene/squalene synthetase
MPRPWSEGEEGLARAADFAACRATLRAGPRTFFVASLLLPVARHAIPRALPEALFEGLAWDAAGRRYQDLPELRAYAARVAGTVGAMMATLMGARPRRWRGPVTSAWRCSSPTSPAT